MDKREETAFFARIVDMANDNAPYLKGKGIDEVKELMDDADIFWGVWQDSECENGIGFLIIKGEPLLQRLSAANQTETLRFDAIVLTCLEEATAMRQVIGEEPLRH